MYVKLWLQVKTFHETYYTARHIFDFWQACQKYPDDLRNKLKASIERNYYSVHPEHVLTAAAVDENENIREWAVDIINRARTSESTNSEVRLYKKPIFRWDAENYWDFVELNDPSQCNPPLLRKYDDLSICITNPETVRAAMNYSCHSQKCEYYVQEVHKAIPICSNPDDVMGVVRLTEESRKIHPRLASKQDFLN